MVDSYSGLFFADYGSASQISQQMVAMTGLIATHTEKGGQLTHSDYETVYRKYGRSLTASCCVGFTCYHV